MLAASSASEAVAICALLVLVPSVSKILSAVIAGGALAVKKLTILLPGGPVMSVWAAYILKIGQARNIAHNPPNKIVVTAKRQRATAACESASLRSDLCKGEVIV